MSKGTKKKRVTVGGLYKSKKDGSLYIKFDQPITVTNYKGEKTEVEFVNLEKPQDEIARLVEYNVLDESKAQERLSKIPENKKYNAIVSF
jgi:hypothetical protein